MMSEEKFLKVAHDLKERTNFDRAGANDNAETNPAVKARAAARGHKRTIDELEAFYRKEINETKLREALLRYYREKRAQAGGAA